MFPGITWAKDSMPNNHRNTDVVGSEILAEVFLAGFPDVIFPSLVIDTTGRSVFCANEFDRRRRKSHRRPAGSHPTITSMSAGCTWPRLESARAYAAARPPPVHESDNHPVHSVRIRCALRGAHEQPIFQPYIRATRPCLSVEPDQTVLGVRGAQNRVGPADHDHRHGPARGRHQRPA